jgi:Ras-related protein Rab-21
MGINLLM